MPQMTTFLGIIEKCHKKLLTIRVNAALLILPQKTFCGIY